MSCVTFPNGITTSQIELMHETLGHPAAFDGFSALYDGTLEIDSKKMAALARAAEQPVEVSLHAEGEIRTMRDGTKYRVTARGWQKIEP